MSEAAEATPVVTVFLRNRGDVLLLRRSDAVGSYPGAWGAVAGHVAPAPGERGEGEAAGGEPTADPDAAARREVREETGIDPATLTFVRSGEPYPVEDPDHGTWLVHPYLFDSPTRAVEANEETVEVAWVAPPAIRRRETVPELWTSWDRVRPTVGTVAGDREHGSATISVRALEVLRDEAALAAEGDWTRVARVARDLRDARPAMRAVANRVNRVMAGADRSPAAVEAAAGDALGDALAVDERAAEAAADRLPAEARVLTLSRSGTVQEALRRADPAAVYVAESRPGGEGIDVAEELAEDREVDVTLLPDAAVAHALATEAIDAVVVGADAVLPDGRVVNKVGTRAAALAAAREGVDCFAVAARDKIATDDAVDVEPRDPDEVYDGDADLAVLAPTFDVSPADAVTVVTEAGPLGTEGIAAVAAEHAANARWDDEYPGTGG